MIRSSLRVLYLVPDLFGLPGGIARCCRTTCQALTESAVELTVVALHDQRIASAEAQTNFPDMRYTPCESNRAYFVARAVAALRMQPDLILLGHVHFISLGRVLAKLGGVPYSTFVYGVEVWNPLSLHRRIGLQRADQVIAISQFTASKVSKINGASPTRVRVLYLCLEQELEQPSQNSRPESNPTLLTVARILRIEQNKGHDQVIRALPMLVSRYPDLRYDIVGDGEGRAELEALAAHVGVGHIVRFHGIVPDDVLARYYSNATIFVMPSRREGFGYVFLEAMAWGCPVVAGNQDAAAEVVRHEETGLLVDPSSTGDLVDTLDRLLGDRELRQRMGTRGREVAHQAFGFDKFRKTLLSYLQEVAQLKGVVVNEE